MPFLGLFLDLGIVDVLLAFFLPLFLELEALLVCLLLLLLVLANGLVVFAEEDDDDEGGDASDYYPNHRIITI